MPTRHSGIDRRSGQRSPAHRRTWIDCGGTRPPIDVQVSNVSSTGARLTTVDASLLPDQFDLTLPRGNVVQATVVWRKEQTAGVCFVEQVPEAMTKSSAQAPMSIAQLRRIASTTNER